MRLEDRLSQQLHRAAARIAAPPGDASDAVRLGRRRRVVSGLAGVAAAAAVAVGLAVLVGSIRPVAGPVATTPTTVIPSTVVTTTPVPSPTTTVIPSTVVTTTPVPSPTTTVGPPVESFPGSLGLPEPVAATRQAIIEAAELQDYDALVDLALARGPTFGYSFGASSSPTREELLEAWQGDQELLGLLVDLLRLPYAVQEADPDFFSWPSAFRENPSEADWAALQGIYSAEEIQSFKDFGGYIGHRVGITADGDWIFFVAGD